MEPNDKTPTKTSKGAQKSTVDFSKYGDVDPVITQPVAGQFFGRTSHNGVLDLVEQGILPPPLKFGNRNHWFLSQIKAGLAELKQRQSAQAEHAQGDAA